MKYTLVNENFSNNYIEKLTAFRGGDLEKMKNCTLEDVEDPILLDNIEKGAELLLKVLRNNNGYIHIIQDCDVDGATSASIMWLYIKRIYPEAKLSFDVHSGKQHGLEDMMDSLQNRDDISLIILPDASSNEYELHKEFKDIGIPILVLDHHIAESYSKNAIVINNQLSERYENKELTGAGVVYQFCRYLDKKLNYNYANDYIDLAALGIISDMGSILSIENYAIIKEGLSKPDKNYFLSSLIEKQAYSIGDISDLNSIAISFYITPLINALIRVGTIEEKRNLFLALIDGHQIVPSTKRGEKGLTEDLTTQVVRNCINARSKQNRIKDKAIEKISIRIFNEELYKNKILLIELDDEEDDFPSELNGLLAMQLASKYKRPTLVVRKNDEGLLLRGSARGLNNSELKSLKKYLESTNLFEYCLGHDQAFGVSIGYNHVKNLIKKSNEELKDLNFNDDSYEVSFERFSYDNDLDKLIFDICANKNVYGQNNPTPLIAINDIIIDKNDIQIMGKTKNTLKFEKKGISFIKFQAEDLIEKLSGIDEIGLQIVGEANINYYGNKITPQIFIKDCNIFDSSLCF